MRPLRHLWKRHVAGRPDEYQAHVSLPDRPSAAAVHDRIEELEHAFEGRLDVYARREGLAVVSDRVPAATFDPERFEAILDRLEETYAGSHRLARLEKWRSIDGRLVTAYVVVPVRPLFPPADEDCEREERAPATAD